MLRSHAGPASASEVGIDARTWHCEWGRERQTGPGWLSQVLLAVPVHVSFPIWRHMSSPDYPSDRLVALFILHGLGYCQHAQGILRSSLLLEVCTENSAASPCAQAYTRLQLHQCSPKQKFGTDGHDRRDNDSYAGMPWHPLVIELPDLPPLLMLCS